MNKTLIFLIISIIIVAFSVITLSSAPVITKTIPESDSWAYENCKIYEDIEEIRNSLNDKEENRKKKTLCERKKAMHSLEYGAFIFNIFCGFFCALLSFLQYLKIGKNFEKNTGLVGFITGIIGFILSFIYFIYSSYIFTNDKALAYNSHGSNINGIEKLFSNGALYKYIGDDSVNGKYITIYEGDKNYESQYIKYSELGQKQYNYDSDYRKVYTKEITITNNCYYTKFTGSPGAVYRAPSGGSSEICRYLYFPPFLTYKNKYIYDKWSTTLTFGFIISICDLALLVFGFLLFKQGDNSSK